MRRGSSLGGVGCRHSLHVASQIVEGTLELHEDIFREITVLRRVVLQVQRVQNHKVGTIPAHHPREEGSK